MKLRIILLLLLFLGLSACTQLNAPTRFPSQNATQLNQLKEWTITGSIGIRTPKDSQTAFINWHQQDTRYSMQIFGPFGAGAVTLNGTPKLVSLSTQSPHKTYSAENAEALIQQQLGWKLPVSNLRYWIRGLAAPQLPATPRWDNNQLAELQQQGWTITYQRYTTVQDLQLPTKIILVNSGLQVRIIIHSWHLA